MEYHYLEPLKPNEFERTLAEVFVRTHECPWYKRIFNKKHKHFVYTKSNSIGIGTTLTVICKNCGKTLDITDYDSW